MNRRNTNRILRDERGATIIVVALSLVFIMGSAAIAIDLGMLQSARAEAQRAADAAALAGASEYLEPLPTETGAEARARDFAGRNRVMGKSGDAEVLEVDVDHAAQRVTVRIQHTHDTWFARILGINTADVGAIAAARVIQSGTAGCIKPFADPRRRVYGRRHLP
jgi:Flp pilus assembly protein TadG